MGLAPDRTEKRILAIDLGQRRIGLALSDVLRLTAQGLETLQRTNIREDLDRLMRLVEERGVSFILVGNPVQMNGTEGRQSERARDFARRLQAKTGRPVKLWDERLTTVEAERVLRESGISRKKRGQAVDRLAAVILLESYLATRTASDQCGDPGK